MALKAPVTKAHWERKSHQWARPHQVGREMVSLLLNCGVLCSIYLVFPYLDKVHFRDRNVAKAARGRQIAEL